jgi:DNA invertase Pin-like site-specific DNA recombinase
VGRFDSRRWWTVLPLIPFTTPHNRGFRISAFCGELQKPEFERNAIRNRTLAGLKAARARGRVGGRPEKLSVRDKQQIRAAALQELVNLLEAARGRGAVARTESLFFDTN